VTGVCRRLIVTGCLPERFRETLVDALPEVDAFLGTGAYETILSAVLEQRDAPCCLLPDPNLRPASSVPEHRKRSTAHTAYIKIAEGCSRHCTYCIIPRLRGRQKSRTPESIRKEVEFLVSTGVKELILVAQETTAYGTDLSPPGSLEALLDLLGSLPGDFWIRFLYGHPEGTTDALIETVARHPKVCRYFDLPIQHAGDTILKKMGRPYTQESLYRLFEKIRTTLPDVALRSTFLVGFPGETEADFQHLCRLVETVRFDHAGVFTYSDAEDLPSHRLGGRVPKATAQKRRRHLMRLQAVISHENNRKHPGKLFPVLLEKKTRKGHYQGRTPFQAPDIDGITRVSGRELDIGTVVQVRITDAGIYDLKGEAV